MPSFAEVKRWGRNKRQVLTYAWVCRAFAGFTDRTSRAERVLEEAIELAQAAGVPQGRAAAIEAKVYAKPPGQVDQEIGGVSCTLLSFAESAGWSADACEAREISRVLSLPVEHFQQRQQAKIEAGIIARFE